MNISKTIAELELKHLIESLLELDLKDKHGMTYYMIFYVNDHIVKDWSDKNIERFIEALNCLGINDISFCCIPIWAWKMVQWAKFVAFAKNEEIPADIVHTVHCFKLENEKTSMSELKLVKNEEFTILRQIEDEITGSSIAFFKMLHIAINENLMLNRPKVLEQHPFMKKISQMFNNY